jgi:plastocyanin
MPFTWKINIKKNSKPPPRAVFEFDQPPQIQVGDQIIWSNADSQPHFPTPDDPSFVFMPNQIAGNSTSPAFTPSKTGTISYTCSLHVGEKGAIEVCEPQSGQSEDV